MDPSLRQLLKEEFRENFLSSLSVPPERQNPLLRQLLTTKFSEDFLSSLSAPSRRQNPLLGQLPQTSQSDQASGLSPPLLNRKL